MPTTEIPTGKVRAALRAAHLYYMQDLTMDAIAHEMHASRSTVSRLLTFARTSGLVEIVIHSPRDHATRLQRAIGETYAVTAHIVPLPGGLSNVDRIERICTAAARQLPHFIDSTMTVGIAWGSTTAAISRHLTPHPLHGVTFVQINGAGNDQTTGVEYASEILDRFAAAYTGTSQQFPVPAFFDNAATKAAMWQERSIRRILDLQRHLDMIIFGIGVPRSPVPSHVYTGAYLTPADRRHLAADHVVGDIATVFFRADGSWRDIAINDRATGPALDRIAGIPRRLAVVADPARAEAVHAALHAGFITDLITDEATAEALLAEG